MSNPTPVWTPREIHLEDWRDELRLDRSADGAVVAAIAVGGLAFDLAVRAGVVGFGGALAAVVAAGALVATRRVVNAQAIALAGLAIATAAWLAIRTSPALIPFDIIATAALLALAASYGQRGSILDVTVPNVVMRAVHGVAHGIAAPVFVLHPLAVAWRARRQRVAHDATGSTGTAVFRGLALALPVVVVLGVLLASADAVFASFFQVHVPFTDAFAHAALIGVGAWGCAGLLRVASAASTPVAPNIRTRLGRIEAVIVLAALDGLFGAFALAQLFASSNGGRHVLQTRGLTYAQYARTGFFQLVAVAVITSVVLVALRAGTSAAPRDRVLVVAAEVAVALTFVIVLVALRRLGLYERVYGFTMLRLYVRVAAWCIAAVFVMLGAALAGVRADRAWLPAGTCAVAMAALLALNIANPEAIVARRDLAFARAGHRFDAAYLASLSEDAIPVLVAGAATLASEQRDQLFNALRASHCESWRWHGWAAANVSRHRATPLLAALCPKGQP